MTIWNDALLHDACARHALVTPYEAALVNPASIDLRLGYAYRLPASANQVGWGDERDLSAHGLTVYPGQFILCCTLETVRIPDDAAAELFSKSSAGRIGLEHLHAGWIDPGFCGQLTLEPKNVAPWPILLQPGKAYMQMVVHDLVAPAVRSYATTGRYQNQTGATPAREVQQ